MGNQSTHCFKEGNICCNTREEEKRLKNKGIRSRPLTPINNYGEGDQMVFAGN